MPIHNYANLNHRELMQIPREKSVVFIPVAPIEQHGAHLPLGMDAFASEYFCKESIQRLEKDFPDWHFILHPLLFAGTHTMSQEGSIDVSPGTLRSLVFASTSAFAKMGFKKQILLGAHGGPKHMVVLEEVAAKTQWKYKAKVISGTSNILLKVLKGELNQKIIDKAQNQGLKLPDNFLSILKTDYHAGAFETSLMLKISPHLVSNEYKNIKPAILESPWKIRPNSGKKTEEGLGHLGSPAYASAELGQAITDVILEEMLPSIKRFISGEDVVKEFRSVFYYIPIFRTDFKWLLILFGYFLSMMAALYIINYLFMESL